jgi:hypothetical protein
VAVKEWSGGTGPTHTLDPFPRPPHPWRLSYRTEPGEPGNTGVVDIIVRNKDDRMMTAAYNLQSAVAGSLTVKEEHPEYYIEVTSHGPKWQVAIEEQATGRG